MNEDMHELIKIDKHDLDNEAVRQPQLLASLHEAYEQAIAKRDTLEERIKSVDAVLDAVVREQHKSNKPTEAAIKGLVQTHTDHAHAVEVYIQAKLEAGKIWALVKAAEQRKAMLELLTQLYLSGYYTKAATSVSNAKYSRDRKLMADARKDSNNG